ncbi:hypothetical protein BU17DRAFT_104074 [Hysterangium stoloniferum]|nr:hypothetical protein BU17DRAFT_104074 [Hysterangium stoloniferum]
MSVHVTRKVAPTAQYNPSIAADTSNRTSVLMASSFTSKENSVVNSRTSSGRCVPVRKPIPAVFAAAHKGKQIENDMDNAVIHEVTRQNKENRKSRVLVDLTKLKVNEEVNITTPVSEGRVGAAGLLTPMVEDPPCLFVSDMFPCSTKESTGITGLKQSIKQSLDKGVRLYKSSALGSYGNLLGNKSTTDLSSVAPELSHSTEGDSTRLSKDTKESWESDAAVHIERVVEDAQANFAAGSMTPLPPLPPQTAQANCRASAKVTEIFQDKNVAGDNSLNDAPPVHQRRVTLVSKSPENHDGEQNRSSDDPAPMPETARKGMSQSVVDFACPITPLVTLELELAKSGMHPYCYTSFLFLTDHLCRNTYTLTKPHLVICHIGPNAFFAPPILVEHEPSADETPFATTERLYGLSIPIRSNELSPITGANYDEILMFSSGVKCLGKGYESHATISHIVEHPASAFKWNPKLFHSV